MRSQAEPGNEKHWRKAALTICPGGRILNTRGFQGRTTSGSSIFDAARLREISRRCRGACRPGGRSLDRAFVGAGRLRGLRPSGRSGRFGQARLPSGGPRRGRTFHSAIPAASRSAVRGTQLPSASAGARTPRSRLADQRARSQGAPGTRGDRRGGTTGDRCRCGRCQAKRSRWREDRASS